MRGETLEANGYVVVQIGGNGLVSRLLSVLSDVLFSSFPIHPNPLVESVHQLTLAVALAGSVLFVLLTGVYYITGGVVGIPHSEIRLIIPRLILGLGFAAVSLPLLQYGIELSDALVAAFQPQDVASFSEKAGLTAGFILVGLVKAVALLALVALFILRNLYLVFIASVTPLLAVGWAFPNTRPYARSFISLWFVMLAIAPADALVLRFSLVMLEGAGALGLEGVPTWILGVAALGLMLWVPYQLIAVSMGFVGGRQLPTSVRDTVRRRWPPGGSGGDSDNQDDDFDNRRRQNRRDRSRRRR